MTNQERLSDKKIRAKPGPRCSSEILKRTPKRYQDLVLWAWLEVFSPVRGTHSKTTHYLLSYFVRLKTLKRTAKASTVEMLRVEHQPRSQGLFPGLGTWERGWAEHPKRYQNPF